ncbi:MAG: flagellar biosynthesis protein FliQ [Oscillospiraceae bacterium]|nr:flagellar biosynthesis protein FliQ [Oscillospiraceae bacterium]
MSQEVMIDLLREAFTIALRLAAPLLLVSLTVGLIISIFQAATQIQEATLTFVPKLVIIGFTLILLANWMMTTMREFVVSHFGNMLNFM